MTLLPTFNNAAAAAAAVILPAAAAARQADACQSICYVDSRAVFMSHEAVK